MRLYLSSFGLGDHPERFVALVGDQRHGLIILNALDGLADRHQVEAVRQRAALASLGLSADVLDLRQHDPVTIKAAVGEPGFFWIRGGNVFMLRMAMARSGFDRLVVDGLTADRYVYAGFSAGPCVLAPDLRGLELCDPMDDCMALHGEVRFDGLGVLDRSIVPHLDSPEHPESEALGRVAERYTAAGRPFWPLRDGQALVIDGEQLELI